MIETTENQMDGTIESAVSSLIAPEEIIEDTIEEETQETEEISAESEVEEEIDSEEDVTDDEEVEASDSDEDDVDQVEDASQSEPDMHTVKWDGQEIEVTLDDLKRDYGGQKFVQKGMQENADMKKEVAAVYEALNNERQVIAELYQSIQQGGIATPPVKPTKELLEADPIGYMHKTVAWEEEMGAYNQQMAQIQQVSQQSSVAAENAHKAYLQEQMQILQKDIPDFADEKKSQILRERLVTTGTNHYGFTTNEISQITDARTIKVLHDAYRYQDIISGKSKAKVKTQSANSVIKPGAKKVSTPKAKIRSRQMAKLKGSGNMKDALDLILNTT